MYPGQKDGFADRIGAAQAAKKAMLANFKPKPMVTADAPLPSRAEEKAAEVERIRAERAAAKEAKRVAAIEAAEEARRALELDEDAMLALKRADRKARKAEAKEEAKAKKDARSAERRNRAA